VTFSLKNAGQPAEVDPKLHPSDASSHLNYDLYRLEVAISGQGWQVQLPNALASVEFGQTSDITVYVLPPEGASGEATIVLKATSESQPDKTAEARVSLSL